MTDTKQNVVQMPVSSNHRIMNLVTEGRNFEASWHLFVQVVLKDEYTVDDSALMGLKRAFLFGVVCGFDDVKQILSNYELSPEDKAAVAAMEKETKDIEIIDNLRATELNKGRPKP